MEWVKLSFFNWSSIFFLTRLPSAGGVYTPGYAFAETSLVERLNSHEVTFETVVKDL